MFLVFKNTYILVIIINFDLFTDIIYRFLGKVDKLELYVALILPSVVNICLHKPLLWFWKLTLKYFNQKSPLPHYHKYA